MAGENPCDLWALSYLVVWVLPAPSPTARGSEGQAALEARVLGKPWANSIFQGCSIFPTDLGYYQKEGPLEP